MGVTATGHKFNHHRNRILIQETTLALSFRRFTTQTSRLQRQCHHSSINKFKDKIATGEPVADPTSAAVTLRHLCTSRSRRTKPDPRPGTGRRWEFDQPGTERQLLPTPTASKKAARNKGEPLTNTPEHLAKCQLNWRPRDRAESVGKTEFTVARCALHSKYENLAKPTVAPPPISRSTTRWSEHQGHTFVPSGGLFRASESVTFQCGFYNLLDKDFCSMARLTARSATRRPTVRLRATTSPTRQQGNLPRVMEEGRRLCAHRTNITLLIHRCTMARGSPTQPCASCSAPRKIRDVCCL